MLFEMQQKEIIKLSGLDAGFRVAPENVAVLQGLETAVGKGELVVIAGRNGSGKTTLIKTMVGLIPYLAGDLLINNKSISRYTKPQLSMMVGYVSTERLGNANLDVLELVSLGRIPHTSWLGRLTGKDQEMIDQSIQLTGLKEIRHRKLSQISDGERQRAMIARSLAQDTEIIILDEPTAFLDVIHRFEVLHLLHKLSRPPHNKTVILSSHDIQITFRYADRFWIIKDKGIIDGSPEDLILQEEIGSLSSDSNIIFDSEAGQFIRPQEPTSSIGLGGAEGMERQWTARALERLGYSVDLSCNESIRVIVNINEGITSWTLEKNDGALEFCNIYELTLHLRN